jgi:RHS repeat-associated protein
VAEVRQPNHGGSYEGNWYQLSDVQFSMVALVRDTGEVEEGVDYDPYGYGRFIDPADYNRVGGFSTQDLLDFNSAWAAGDRSADINRSGAVTTQDFFDYITAYSAAQTVTLGSGWISDSSPTGVYDAGRSFASGVGPDNTVGYCGYQFNAETGDCTVRYREYNSRLGRWSQRDPAKYRDGMSLLQYCESEPVRKRDPLGLEECTRCEVGQVRSIQSETKTTITPPGIHPDEVEDTRKLIARIDMLWTACSLGKTALEEAAITALAEAGKAVTDEAVEDWIGKSIWDIYLDLILVGSIKSQGASIWGKVCAKQCESRYVSFLRGHHWVKKCEWVECDTGPVQEYDPKWFPFESITLEHIAMCRASAACNSSYSKMTQWVDPKTAAPTDE